MIIIMSINAANQAILNNVVQGMMTIGLLTIKSVMRAETSGSIKGDKWRIAEGRINDAYRSFVEFLGLHMAEMRFWTCHFSLTFIYYRSYSDLLRRETWISYFEQRCSLSIVRSFKSLFPIIYF